MRPVSARLLSTLRGSHTAVFQARLVEPGQTGVDPVGVDIPIRAGDVQLSATADVRSTLDLTTVARWPDRQAPMLAPYGTEVWVARGVVLGATTEWVSLGYHRIYGIEQDSPPDGPVRISARDRMSAIVDARLTEPRQLESSMTYGQAVSALVLEVLPWAVIEWDDNTSNRALGRTVLVEEDRHGALRDLAESVGKIMYWDHRGVLVIRTPPDPAVPVWDVTHGRDGVLVSMARELSREGVYNAVVARGEGADTETPIQAVVVDDDPDSPTYWHGGFGKVPRFYASPLITGVAQAQSAAASLLKRSLGLPYSVSFGTIVNPALEPLDPIRITYPGKAERHVVETLTIPLTAGAAMTGTTREQTLTIIGVT